MNERQNEHHYVQKKTSDTHINLHNTYSRTFLGSERDTYVHIHTN